jgi:hypothetical protein
VRNVYELQSRWELGEGRETVWDGLEELLKSEDPMSWWPSVHVESRVRDDLNVRASSHLGYSLRFRIHDLRADRPDTMTVRSDGDLRGSGFLTFVDISSERSAIDVQWNVSVDRRWMRATSWILRPVFGLGHRLVMAQGEKNLNRWLATRATGSPLGR